MEKSLQKKIIYLPLEVKIREYHAKLLFSLCALSRGYQIIFGSKWAVDKRIGSVPQGVVVGTGVTKVLGGDLLEACKHGHRAVAFDEEGLSYINRENFMQNRITEEVISSIDHFFTWGEHHSELVRLKIPDAGNISAAGNMRLELLKEQYHGLYKDAVEDIKKRYGDFVLINSNLKVYNHIIGEEKLFKSLRDVSFIQNSEDESFYKDRYTHQKVIFDSYKSLLEALAPVISPVKIVVRPHTSENKQTWEALNIPNVYVDNTGGVVPWILASKAVIQKNCTTAIETAYLNRPIITYSVKHDPRFDNDITRNIGILCSREREAVDAIAGICSGTAGDDYNKQAQKDKEFLRYYVSNMEPEENVASSVIDVLDKIDLPQFDDSGALFAQDKPAGHYMALLKKKAIAIAGKKTSERQYKRQKFPGLSHKELKRDIRCLSASVGLPAESIHTAPIGEDLYRMSCR